MCWRRLYLLFVCFSCRTRRLSRAVFPFLRFLSSPTVTGRWLRISLFHTQPWIKPARQKVIWSLHGLAFFCLHLITLLRAEWFHFCSLTDGMDYMMWRIYIVPSSKMFWMVFLSGRNLKEKYDRKAELLHIVNCTDTHASILLHYTSCCKVQCSYNEK